MYEDTPRRITKLDTTPVSLNSPVFVLWGQGKVWAVFQNRQAAYERAMKKAYVQAIQIWDTVTGENLDTILIEGRQSYDTH